MHDWLAMTVTLNKKSILLTSKSVASQRLRPYSSHRDGNQHFQANIMDKQYGPLSMIVHSVPTVRPDEVKLGTFLRRHSTLSLDYPCLPPSRSNLTSVYSELDTRSE